MKVVRIYEYGGPHVLQLEEAQEPIPGPNDILIKVKATAINPVDWKIRKGYIKERLQLPAVLGCDVSGVVEALGEEVTDFQLNDEVYAMADLFKAGAYAEYVVVNSRFAALKPQTLNFEEAAAVPLAALTAWQALFDEAKLTENQRVLIHAASGGVGSFAVQLAKAKGAYVIATTSAHNIELVKNLGADEIIDYTQSDFATHVSNVDAVLDPIGGDTQERSFSCLKPGGKLVTIVGLNHPDKGIHMLVKPNGERLAEIAALIDQGKVKPLIDRIMMLKEVQEAHEISEAGHARGKIVLRVAK